MHESRVPESAIASFRLHYQRLCDGERGFLPEEAIQSIRSLPDSEDFGAYEEAGRSAMSSAAVIKLNGGLGTSMGLNRAKSLLPVRDDLSFLDLIARQVLALRTEVETDTPLLLMNSFRTANDSDCCLAGYPELALGDLALGFYTAIKGSGMLDRLLERGIQYAFVSNADNLGAALEPSLLGFMVTEGIDFMLEAADRTPADRKGGHLSTLQDGRLVLRESAQCPPEEAESFQDIGRHRYFNTNNLWLHLPSLSRLLDEHGGFLPLPTVVNHKTLDPRDPTSPAVFQLETVMGTAISSFPNAAAVRVPRHRFSPVKNTNDLLGVRSDAFELGTDGRIVLSSGRDAPPVIRLDEDFFKMIDDFEARFPSGAPSLRLCDRLTVDGDVTFGSGIIIEGEVVIRAGAKASVPAGSVVRGTIDL
jgi:UTP--glucose-1-phosphate uridylyltransferase